MLLHVIDALTTLRLERIVVVVGHGAEVVTKTLQEQSALDTPVELVEQRVQRGTGDAVGVALTASAFEDLDAEDDLLIVPGDTPLLRPETLVELVAQHSAADAAATILTARISDPTGYGRVVRDRHGDVARIVEHADASEEERAIDEVNTSIYCFRRPFLAPALRRLRPSNAQQEYYLTDAIEVLTGAGHRVAAAVAADPDEVAGVNDRLQLATAEAELRARVNAWWMREGVTMVDPSRVYIDADVELAPDVRLLPGTMLEGRTVIGSGSVIGPACRLIEALVGERCTVTSSVIKEAEIASGCAIGPFAYLRPGTRVASGAKVGTFVEIKNSDIGEGAKVPHLSYVGDAEVGAGSNLGASTITANYDGRQKHRTKIGRHVHTGVHTSLRAPVEVGEGAETGAGSVVTNDVAPGMLVKGVPARPSRPAGPPVREDEGSDQAG